MPRIARRKSRTGIYHIIMRGNNQQTIFEDDQDRLKFLDTLGKYKEESKYKIYSYCLMDNHVHLLWQESEEESVSTSIKRICSSYVFWYNMKYDRSGHLFQGRFKSENVEDLRYFKTVLRYIHQNPVKAGLAVDVFDCKWTSFYAYFGNSDLVDIDFGLSCFSNDVNEAKQLYIEYMMEENDDECIDFYEEIRKSDDEVREYFYELGIRHPGSLQQMGRNSRDDLLRKIKANEGVSIRQLSRITGISKSVIGRVE